MAELKARIGRRRLILVRTLAECRRLLVAKSTLQALEGSLHKFGEHCELILDQLKRPPSELATGFGSSGSARAYSIIGAKLFALRRCERNSLLPVCTLTWCDPDRW